MSVVEHVIRFEPPQSFRTAEVRGMFDYSTEVIEQRWSVEIPDESEDWKIGVIVGPSGSGKTQITTKRFGEKALSLPVWNNLPLIENFPTDIKTSDVCDLLTRVGLGSIPAWLLPYHALSNGQRFRANIARLLACAENKTIVVDEFSSVVDRTVAKTTSAVLSKFIRKSTNRFVAVTCHYDIIDWLEPDWVLDMTSGKLVRGSLWRRPKVELSVFETGREYWPMFKKHHYLNGELHKSAKCFLATLDGEPCAFCAVIYYPHRQLGCVFRVHRVVTLPDYQGLGLSMRMMDVIARSLNKDFYITTSHRPFAASLARSKDWAQVRPRGFSSPASRSASVKGGHRRLCMTAGFKFVGKAKAITGLCTAPEGKA